MDASQVLDPRKTIFVGGVPRPLRAVELALIMDRLYGGVCYAGIDVDPELKYPKGIFHGRKLVVGSRVGTGQALICSLTLEKLQTWMINVPRILSEVFFKSAQNKKYLTVNYISPLCVAKMKYILAIDIVP